MITFPSVTSISGWAKSTIQYLEGSEKLPFVLKGNLYHYFSLRDGQYYLFCTSLQDLNRLERK